jgi:membrane-anchored glycerophosphoryl diester phosphodiesterase (GDPDase)
MDGKEDLYLHTTYTQILVCPWFMFYRKLETTEHQFLTVGCAIIVFIIRSDTRFVARSIARIRKTIVSD